MASKLTLTNSAVHTFFECPRRYYWRYVRGLDLSVLPWYMEVGSYFSKGLEVGAKTGDTQKAISAIPAATDAGLIARFLVEMYLYNHRATEPWKVLDAEIEFRVSVGKDIILRGKIDGVVEQGGEHWILERKTTGFIDPQYLEKVRLDKQITTYMYGLSRCAGSRWRDIVGAIYDVTARPAKYRRKDESAAEWLGRCTEDYVTDPDNHFATQKAYRSKDELAAFEQELVTTAALIRTCHKMKCFPHQDARFCFQRNRKCPYVTLCTEGETDRAMMNYVFRSPFSELSSEEGETSGGGEE